MFRRLKYRTGSKNKSRIYVYLLLVLCLVPAGCGEKERGSLEEDMSGLGAGTGSGSDAVQAAGTQTEVSDIPEHITYELTTADGTGVGVLDADVAAAGYNNVSIYDMEPAGIDEAYLKELAEQIFDGGEYEVVKPYRACTMDELLAEQSFLQSLYAGAGIEGDDMPSLLVDHYIAIYNETDIEAWEEGQVIFTVENIWLDDVTGERYDMSYEEADLRGTVNGEWYQLEYENWADGSQSLCLRRVRQKNTIFYKLYEVDDSLSVTLYGENACDRSRAEQEACHLVKQMGFSGMEPVLTNQLIWKADGKQYADGYAIILARAADGVDGVFVENSLALLPDEYEKYKESASAGERTEALGSNQQYMSVYMDSSGFAGIQFSVFYRMGEKLTDTPEKLTFEQVCSVAESLARENMWLVGAATQVRLTYITILYEDKYVLAPVWLFSDNGAGDGTYADFGIHAIDGSIIYFGYDYRTDVMLWGNFFY